MQNCKNLEHIKKTDMDNEKMEQENDEEENTE